jgi:hypothetical protein
MPPEAPASFSWPPRIAPKLAHRLTFFLLAFLERATPPDRAAPLPPQAAAAHCCCSSAGATSCSSSPTRRLQAGRRPSPSPLAFSRALHFAPSLFELCPAATEPPSWLVQCVPLPPFFSGLRPSVVPSSSISPSLALAFHTKLRIHHRRPLFVSDSPQLLPIHDNPSHSFTSTL